MQTFTFTIAHKYKLTDTHSNLSQQQRRSYLPLLLLFLSITIIAGKITITARKLNTTTIAACKEEEIN